MFRRLRATIRGLIQLPAQLSTLRMLVEHSITQSRETNDLLRELTVRQTGNMPITPPTPPLDLTMLTPPTVPPDPVKLPSRHRRTGADVVVADRAFLLEEQEKRRVAEAQALRENQRIV